MATPFEQVCKILFKDVLKAKRFSLIFDDQGFLEHLCVRFPGFTENVSILNAITKH